MNSDNALPAAGVETYLGDGLFVSFDGYQLTLRAPRLDGDHLVALEPPIKTSWPGSSATRRSSGI